MPLAFTERFPWAVEFSTPAVKKPGPGFFTAGVENSTATGNLSVDSNGTAVWTPNASAADYQYVRLGLSNLSGWNGLRVEVMSPTPVPLVERLWYGSTFFDVSGYPTVVPTAKNLWQYWFLYPAGDLDMPSSLLDHLGNVTALELGLLPPGPADPISLSNLALVQVTTPRLASVELAPVPANATTLNISLPPTGRLGFLLVSSGSFPVAAPYVRDTQSQPSATELDFTGSTSGWGILALAQTYSPQWTVSGRGAGPLAEVDVGLTGWLVNATAATALHVRYGGQALEGEALYIEVAAVPIALTPWWYRGLRAFFAARRRAPGAP